MIKYENDIRFDIDYKESNLEEIYPKVYLSLTNKCVKLRIPNILKDKTDLFIDKVVKILKVFPEVNEPYHLKSKFNYNATVFKFFNEEIKGKPKNIKIRLEDDKPKHIEYSDKKVITLADNRQFEVVYTTGKYNKLTIALNRVTLKIKENYRDKEVDYIKRAQEILQLFPKDIQVTYRLQDEFALHKKIYTFINNSSNQQIKIEL